MIDATNGPYCGDECPAQGAWDLDTGWCDVFMKRLEIRESQGVVRCEECSSKEQDEWYPIFSKWREAIRQQDKDDKAKGKLPSKYLRDEYRGNHDT